MNVDEGLARGPARADRLVEQLHDLAAGGADRAARADRPPPDQALVQDPPRDARLVHTSCLAPSSSARGRTGLLRAYARPGGLRVVEVREARGEIGGGIRTEELTLPGFRHDVCSAIHPTGRASPIFRVPRGLGLDSVAPPAACGRPSARRRARGAARAHLVDTAGDLGPDAAHTAGSSGRSSATWRRFEPVLLGPFPPSARPSPARAARSCPGALLPAPRSARTRAAGARSPNAGALLFAGSPRTRCSRSSGGRAPPSRSRSPSWATWSAGPFPRGARRRSPTRSPRATRARRRDANRRPVDGLAVEPMSCSATSAPGATAASRRLLPAGYERALSRYRHGPGAFKLDWALDGPIPWRDPSCARAATVHLGGTLDEIAASERGAWRGTPQRPFLLLAQHEPLRPDAARRRAAHRLGVLPRAERLDCRHDGRDRGAGRAVRAGLPRRILARHVMTPADSRGAQPQPRRRRHQRRDDRPLPVSSRGRSRAEPVPDAAARRLPLLGARRRPAAACTACAGTGRP